MSATCTSAATIQHCWQPAAQGPQASRLLAGPRRAFSADLARHYQPFHRSRVAARSASEAQQAASVVRPTEWFQKTIELPPVSRGCHVITRRLLEQLPELQAFEMGMANIFVQHTSASLTINENASPDVPLDLADSLDRLVPEGNKHQYRHNDEGPDDMPAHVKSSLMGPSLTLPVQHGRLALGIWQGIYLNEHRNAGGPRRLVVTVQGVKRADSRKYPPSNWR